jgi:hypothetical protein
MSGAKRQYRPLRSPRDHNGDRMDRVKGRNTTTLRCYIIVVITTTEKTAPPPDTGFETQHNILLRQQYISTSSYWTV